MSDSPHNPDPKPEDQTPSGESFSGGKPGSSRLREVRLRDSNEGSVGPRESFEERLFSRLKYVIVAVIVLGAVWLLGQLILFEREPEPDRTPTVTAEEQARFSIDSLLNQETFRTAFLDANGGEEYLNSLKSIRVTGSLETPEETKTFSLIKRNPGQRLIKSEAEDGMVTIGTRGKIAWRAFRENSVYKEVYYLSGESREHAVESSRFFDGLMDHFLNDRGSFRRISTTVLDGEEVIEVEIDGEDGSLLRYWVDPVDLFVLQAVKVGEDETTKHEFSDFRRIGKIYQPFRQEIRRNGDLVTTLVIENAELNTGIHPFLFKKPETTAPGRLQGGWNMAEDARARGEVSTEAFDGS